MNTHPVFTAEQYELLLTGSLIRLGMDADEARFIVASRWPMAAAVVLCECEGRGLRLTLDDLADFQRERYGEDVSGEDLPWLRYLTDALLRWAQAKGRGERCQPGASLPCHGAIVTTAEMLDALRSPDLAFRTIGLILLATSIGAGCKVAGETDEDFEHIIVPQLNALLTRASLGDAEAVDELERITTLEHPAERRARLQALSN